MLFDKQKGIHQPPLKGPRMSFGSGAPKEFFNKFTETSMSAGAIVGYIILSVVLACALYWIYRRRRQNQAIHKANPKFFEPNDADLGFVDDADVGPSRAGGFGLFRTKRGGLTATLDETTNLNYRDDPDGDEGSGGLTGRFHKTFSDLPQSGKHII